MRCLWGVLGLILITGAEAAEHCTVWTIGSATYRYCPESRELAVTQGNVTFHPVVGLGPEFLWQGKPQPLAEVKVDLVRAETDLAGLICHFLDDRASDLRYLAPRGGHWLDQTQPTLWRAGKIVLRVDPRTGDAWINGQQRNYRPPRLAPLSRIDFRFDLGTLGWSRQRDLGPLRIENGALKAEIVGGDPGLGAPPIDLPPDSVKTVVIRLRVTCGRFGQFY